MRSGELISIIVPVYNTESYLTRCVDSLRTQTYTDLEIILVDDGSTDGSGTLCDRFAAEDKRIKVLHKENGGSSSARNLGIAKARGKYIGFVDSDDYVDADMYEKLYAALQSGHVNAAQIGRDEIAPDGSVMPDICIPPKEQEFIPPEKFLEELLMHLGDCSFCTKLIRTDCFRALQGMTPVPGSAKDCSSGQSADIAEYFPVGRLNEDFYLLVRLLGQLGPIVSLPGHAYHVFYRVGSNSRKESRDVFSRVFADSVDNADMVARIVEERYPGLKSTAFRFGIFQRLEYMLHIPIAQMTGQNEMYREIVGFLRKNWIKSMCNPILTGKNKVYHTLFAVAPVTVRKVHRFLRRPDRGR